MPISDAPALRPLAAVFFERSRELGDKRFIFVGGRGQFTWREMATVVSEIALGLKELGLSKGERVSLLSENSFESVCLDLATAASGVVLVSNRPVYSDRMVARILAHSRCRAVFVPDAEALARIERIANGCPALDTVVVFDGKAQPSSRIRCVTLDDVRALGRRSTGRIDDLVGSVSLDDVATIEYTSGSSGAPKGVVKTHRSIVVNFLAPMRPDEPLRPARSEETVPLTLTLNHILGRGQLHRSVVQGRPVAMFEFSEAQLRLRHIREMAPVIITVVPRLLTRLWDDFVAENPAVVVEAKDQASKRALRDALVRGFGGRLERVFCTGAAIPPKIERAFSDAELPLTGYYGTTECGVITLPDGPRPTPRGSVGWPYPGTEVKLASDAEVLVRGPGVMSCYLDDPAATREVLEEDGWYHTGDLGSFDPDGSLRIVGRKKDIFLTSEGANIFPEPIERALEGEPFIRQAVLVGDRRPYLAALLVPDVDHIGATLSRAPTEEEITAMVWERVEALNEQLEVYERVRRIAILSGPVPESVRAPAGILGKLRTNRAAVDEVFAGQIATLYA